MNRVKVKKWIQINNGKGHYDHSEKIADGEAEFCAWGVDCQDFEHGAGTFSTAIIKRDDGSIENVHCELIQFIS